MITIKTSNDKHGVRIQSSKATRYVSKGLLGTICETMALREVIEGSRPNAVIASNVRAPADWGDPCWRR
jgi:hypothetical protein